MQRLGKRVSEYVKHETAKGRDLIDVLRDQTALELHGLDQDAGNKAFMETSKSGHLEKFLRSRAEQGLPPHFVDQDEVMAAMSDPAYARSEEYRSAIAAIISQTPAEVMGVSGHAKGPNGEMVKVGRNKLSEAATPESMLREAYRDMIREQIGKIDRSTAKGRYEYMQLLTDPNNAEVIAEIESMMVSPEQLRRQALMDEKAAGGENLRVQIGHDGAGILPRHDKDINFQTGTYADGSPLPLGDASVDGRPI